MSRDHNDPLPVDPHAEPTDTPVLERIALALRTAELGERQRLDLRQRVLARVREQSPAGTTTIRADEMSGSRYSQSRLRL